MVSLFFVSPKYATFGWPDVKTSKINKITPVKTGIRCYGVIFSYSPLKECYSLNILPFVCDIINTVLYAWNLIAYM